MVVFFIFETVTLASGVGNQSQKPQRRRTKATLGVVATVAVVVLAVVAGVLAMALRHRQ
jgi:amino acid transporter